MDHGRVYEALMARAKVRGISGYAEKHHIVPRCLGGPNHNANIVLLTAREHVMAHKLLVRMYPGNLKLWHALMLMGRLKVPASRITAKEREEYAKRRREFRYSDESKAKMSDSAKKRGSNAPATEFQKGQTAWNKGLTGYLSGRSQSDETRAKMKSTQQANREAQSARMKQWWQERKRQMMEKG